MPEKQKQKPIDDAPSAAALAEATEQNGVRVVFGGNTYAVDPEDFTSIEFLEAAQRGNDALMIAALLGPAQWQLFKLHHKKRTDLNAMAEAIGEAAGSGNS